MKTQNKSRKKFLVFLSVTFLVTLIIWLLTNYHPEETQPLEYTVEKKNLIQYESFSGTIIFSDETSVICQKSYPVKEVFVQLGDTVSVGDKLYSYDSAPCLEQIAEYEKLLSEISSQGTDASRETTQNNYQLTLDYLRNQYAETEQEIVQAEENLKLDKEELAKANEQKAKLSAELKAVREKTANITEENPEEKNPEDAYDEDEDEDEDEEQDSEEFPEEDAEWTEKDLQEQRLSADMELLSDKTETLSERITSAEQALETKKTQLNQLAFEIQKTQNDFSYAGNSDTESLHLLNESLIQFYQSKISTAQAELENLTVFSDKAGIVSQISQKSQISLNSTVMKIAVPEQYSASFSAPADKCFSLRKGMKAEVSVSTCLGREFQGNLSSVLSEDEETYQLTVTLDDGCAPFMMYGAKAYAKIIYAECSPNLVVPYDYICYDETGSAYVITLEDGQMIKKTVEILFDSDYYTAVSSQTLQEHDVIIKSEV